jgi:hypothetical protein
MLQYLGCGTIGRTETLVTARAVECGGVDSSLQLDCGR